VEDLGQKMAPKKRGPVFEFSLFSRVSYNDITLGYQPNDEGLIPSTRSNFMMMVILWY
tara:strand:- start:314 stop:487 length:174 start_codon:yes stop_codon:yes gene_type:complete